MTDAAGVRYRAASLEAIAQLFDQRAKAERAIGAWGEATTWESAAALLRSTTLETPEPVGTSKPIGEVQKRLVDRGFDCNNTESPSGGIQD